MKAGLKYSDAITTVSPTYAHEITGTEQGCGLDGVLRQRQSRLHGILNGVDDAVWNPLTDTLVQPGFDADHLQGKAQAKARLQERMGLQPRADALLFSVVSRLTEQKGLHLLPAVVDELVQRGGQLAVLGSGDAAIEQALRDCARRHPGQVALTVGYDEALAHSVIAGADVILLPSRFEPCGLTQLYGLRYGTLPLVRAVGGLADTVVDSSLENLDDGSASGFVFHELDVADLLRALRRAFALQRRPAEWRAVQRHAMGLRFGWERAAADYLRVYKSAVHDRASA
jgi:starch synthase